MLLRLKFYSKDLHFLQSLRRHQPDPTPEPTATYPPAPTATYPPQPTATYPTTDPIPTPTTDPTPPSFINMGVIVVLIYNKINL